MEQIPLNFELPWKNNQNIKPEPSQFPDSENIVDIKFINGAWVAVYRPDDAGEMYKR